MVTTDVRWLNPFIVSAFTVLRSFGVEPVRTGHVAIEQAHCTTDPVTVIIPVTGDLEGTVFYGMDSHTALMIARMMAGNLLKVRLDEALVQSALGELGNMVTGHASAQLEEQGKRCTIAPPIVAMDARLIVAAEPFTRLVVPIEFHTGAMRVHLALREKS